MRLKSVFKSSYLLLAAVLTLVTLLALPWLVLKSPIASAALPPEDQPDRSAVVASQGITDGYVIVHYYRPAGDYGDWTSGDFNDYWGLHLWGAGVDEPGIGWSAPKKFAGIDDFGAYVALKVADPNQPINYIVHKGNDKDTPNDRSFVPADFPELWIVQGDANNYASRAEAQNYVVVHYNRPGGDYTGWGLHLWQGGVNFTTWAAPLLPAGTDDYGAYFVISKTAYPSLSFTLPLSFAVHNGDTRDIDTDRSFVPAQLPAVWLKQAALPVYPHRGAVENYAVIHYRRQLGDYGNYSSTNYIDYWGVHAWGGVTAPGWTSPYTPTGQDTYGVYFKLPLNAGATSFNYILHRGDTKDPDGDQTLDVITTGYEIWVAQGLVSGTVQSQYSHPAIPLAKQARLLVGDLGKQQAYWVNENTIAWARATDPNNIYRLYYDANAGLTLVPNGINGGQFITLTVAPAGLPADVRAKFPHLAGLPALTISTTDVSKVADILKGQFAVASFSSTVPSLNDATGLQIPGVLDALYTYTGTLGVVYNGVTPSVKLWAPTAQQVNFYLYDDSVTTTASFTAAMAFNATSGVWSVTGLPSWTGKYYLYEVVVFAPGTGQIEHNFVTDPYAVSLSMNSTRSQIVNLNDAALKPAGWDALTKPAYTVPENSSIYELHVRDFSMNDTTVPTAARGTFMAFTYTNTNGMRHLTELAQAGLSHLHLLPVFDFATVNENPAARTEPDWSVLASYPASSTQQQALINPLRDLDGFNWGYDPLHYSVPEGSYSTNPTGTTRVVEFRQMVKSLNQAGLRVVVDVVYNHTSASGQTSNSVLDRIVPGYYHRLNSDGGVESSTCCANTASENAMMEKLMIDSAVMWARYYKVDGFRFDLMGHHMKSNMLNLRAALDALTLANDGVNGREIYVYGEGWDFGEVANNARGVNATQRNMAGTGIGTFNDRSRDAVRGGGPFDSGNALVTNQGFISGLYYDPNELNAGASLTVQKASLLHSADLIRVGLAGNLATYTFTGATGAVISGAGVDYNGSPAGYTADPQENIFYISAHDNQTLYDMEQYKMPLDSTRDERVRADNVGVSFVCFAQGVPFMQAGTDMLRSKSFDSDSYNSSDWFNRLDFSYQSNNFGAGLPPANANQTNWPLMEPRLANVTLKPGYTEIMSSVRNLRELFSIRASTRLFHLQTAAEVQEHLKYYNTGPDQIPGLIVMALADPQQKLSDRYDLVVTLFNATDDPVVFSNTQLLSKTLTLHPVQAGSYDPVVKTARYQASTGVFTVPARTTAVFVQLAKQYRILLPLVMRGQ